MNEKKEEIKVLKQVISEHQKFIESVNKEKKANNVFVSGIPISLKLTNDDMPPVTSSKDIIQHIFLNLHATISPEDYDILKDIPTKPEHSRHSMVIQFKVVETRKAILKECKKFKNLDVSHPLRFVYIKHDMSPLTKRRMTVFIKKIASCVIYIKVTIRWR